jgi:peptidoglycan hydrolase-like amidase
MIARAAILAAAFLTISPAAEVRVAVFGLFHPSEVRVMHGSGSEITLSVPGRIERRFEGRVELIQDGDEVVAVIAMNIETAVASIVAAESPPGSGIESLKAQAVVARSYLMAARGRHPHSDFCDTTHCQFLRDPPPRSSLAARAAEATEGMVLQYEGRVIEALYSADCGGTTRARASGPYPYFAVACPVRTTAVSGHRLGLCQVGAASMARAGATWIDILRHYFPAAAVITLQ